MSRLEQLEDHVADHIRNSDVRTLGNMLRYLRPHNTVPESLVEDLSEACMQKARDLSDWGAFLDGVDEWREPPDALMNRSALADISGALAAADWLNSRFGKSCHETLFEIWADSLPAPLGLVALIGQLASVSTAKQMLVITHQRHSESGHRINVERTGKTSQRGPTNART
jgi:hypothetical protein